MTTINDLSSVTQISSGDQIPVFSINNGITTKVSINNLLSFFEKSFASPTMATISNAGLTNNFSVAVPTPVSQAIWMQLLAPNPMTLGTITLPLNTQTPDGTEILVTCNQAITTLTLSLNGAAAVLGAPSTLLANGFFKIRYDAPNVMWFRVG